MLKQTFRNSAAAIARITPEQAPLLRRLSIVNYLEALTTRFAQQSSSQVVDTVMNVIGAPLAWTLGFVGPGATITIIDSGIDSTHYWNPSGDGPASLAYCGYVNGVASTCYQDPNFAHGALVAGIAGGRNNCCGFVGVAYGPAQVNSIRVSPPNSFEFSEWAEATALDRATSSGFPRHIVNVSAGGCSPSSVESEAVARANAAGIMMVVIARNAATNCSGKPAGSIGLVWPGRVPEVLAVTGTNSDGSFNWGSRYGPEVSLSAMFCQRMLTQLGFVATQPICGTSYAAPIVAGVAALVWSAHPSWSASAVETRMEASSVDNYTPGRVQYFGFGLVSAINAVQTPLSVTVSGPSTSRPPGRTVGPRMPRAQTELSATRGPTRMAEAALGCFSEQVPRSLEQSHRPRRASRFERRSDRQRGRARSTAP